MSSFYMGDVYPQIGGAYDTSNDANLDVDQAEALGSESTAEAVNQKPVNSKSMFLTIAMIILFAVALGVSK